MNNKTIKYLILFFGIQLAYSQTEKNNVSKGKARNS